MRHASFLRPLCSRFGPRGPLTAMLSALLAASLLCVPIAPAGADALPSPTSTATSTPPDTATASESPGTASAASPHADGTIVHDGISYLAESSGSHRTATVTAYDPHVGGNGATVPKTVAGFGGEYTITAIGERAFMATGLVQVRLPDTVSTIGADAFSDNPGLRSVALGGIVSAVEPASSAHHSFDPSVEITYPATLDSEIVGQFGFSHPMWRGYTSRYRLPVPARARITVDRPASDATDHGSSAVTDGSPSVAVTVEVTPKITGVVAGGTVELTIRNRPEATIRLTLDSRGIAGTHLTVPRGSAPVEITADYLGDGSVESTTASTRVTLSDLTTSRDGADGPSGAQGAASRSGNVMRSSSPLRSWSPHGLRSPVPSVY